MCINLKYLQKINLNFYKLVISIVFFTLYFLLYNKLKINNFVQYGNELINF